jgi:TPR repeat protein
MDWTVRGMDEATRRRAEAAATAAGLPLSAWLDRTILANADSYVPPPSWQTQDRDEPDGFADDASDDPSDDPLADPAAQAAIQQALDALEARLDARASAVANVMTPLSQKLDEFAEQGQAPVPPVLRPNPSYRRGLGLIAVALIVLSLGGVGGIVWLWFDMQEPPPNPYAEMDPSQWRQTLSPAAREAMRAPGTESASSAATPAAAPSPATPLATTPPTTTPSGTPTEYADLEVLIAQSRAGTLAVPDAPSDSETDSTPAAAGTQLAPTAIAQIPVRPPAAATQLAASDSKAPTTGAPASDAQLIAQLRASAAKNDAKAQHDLGLLLMEGRLLPRDEKAAGEMFEKAAVQGLANAQYNLGVMYDNGIGRPADQTMAYFWYSAAADQGHIAAQYNLGVAAAQGKGAPRDYAVAALWFERAAKGGLPDAQYNLGQLYENGFGVEVDLQTAYDLYSDAASQGYPPARQRMIALEGRVAARPLPVVPQRTTPATVPSTVVPPVSPTLARKDVAEIQSLLRKLALMQGAADGTLGPATRTAIRQYQAMAGLKTDGEPSLDLLQELREVAGN